MSAQESRSDVEAEIQIPLEDAFSGAKRTLNVTLPGVGEKTLNVTLPKGIREGQRIRLKGQGRAGPGGAGDLLLRVRYAPHREFSVSDPNLETRVQVFPWQVALKRSVRVPTLAGPVDMKLPASARPGTRLRLKGRGLPLSDGGNGDLLVTVEVVVPEAADEATRALYEQLEASAGNGSR